MRRVVYVIRQISCFYLCVCVFSSSSFESSHKHIHDDSAFRWPLQKNILYSIRDCELEMLIPIDLNDPVLLCRRMYRF